MIAHQIREVKPHRGVHERMVVQLRLDLGDEERQRAREQSILLPVAEVVQQKVVSFECVAIIPLIIGATNNQRYAANCKSSRRRILSSSVTSPISLSLSLSLSLRRLGGGGSLREFLFHFLS